jgi:hypothetical protein
LFCEPVASSAFWPWLRRLILDQPLLIAERTGVEWMAWGPKLKNPGPSPTLTEVGKVYLDNAKISEVWRSKCKQFWNEFVELAEVRRPEARPPLATLAVTATPTLSLL